MTKFYNAVQLSMIPVDQNSELQYVNILQIKQLTDISYQHT